MNINLKGEKYSDKSDTLQSHACSAAAPGKDSLCLLRDDDQSQNDQQAQGAEDQQGHRRKLRR